MIGLSPFRRSCFRAWRRRSFGTGKQAKHRSSLRFSDEGLTDRLNFTRNHDSHFTATLICLLLRLHVIYCIYLHTRGPYR
ncbi:hypothetical protein BDZ85DRAFT_53137 [Elsinoe ampelina]|uniref:Uncharacterized protein n=1 Tax=Elsinoe ampelina TaxID=302913 RepID=A0A6A6GMW0_9PEZI|nr:hypothetical protein BDZ85DRAFT_53137 [Elsinoe ampelina]